MNLSVPFVCLYGISSCELHSQVLSLVANITTAILEQVGPKPFI